MAIDAQQLRAQCIFESRAPLGSLLADLEQLGGLLRACEVFRGRLRKLGVIFLAAGVVGFVVANVVEMAAIWLLAVPAFLAGVALLIYSFRYARDLVKHRDRLELLRELVRVLQQDADKTASFAVRLALKDQSELLSEEPWPQRKRGKQRFFKDEWLSLDGALLDGARVSESVTELSRRRTYQNPRGKWKTKTRSRYLVAVKVTYPAGVYGDATPVHHKLHEEVRVPPSAVVREVRVSEKAINIKAVVNLKAEIAQSSAMLSMGAYRILNLARRVAGAQSKREGAR